MEYETIILEKINGVGKITLNRPDSLNALNYQCMLDLEAALADIREDGDTRCVVITGAGRAFCAGGDTKQMTDQHNWGAVQLKDYVRRFGTVGRDMWELEKPIIMAINGTAVGGGCNFALCGDILIASEKAKFAEFFVLRGLMPDFMGIYTLPKLVGLQKTKELCFTGDMIDAQEALKIGLVSKVTPHEELIPTAMALATRLATERPPLALGMTKMLLHKAIELDLRSILEYEAFGQGLLLQTEDHKEAVSALFEKRLPKFKGK